VTVCLKCGREIPQGQEYCSDCRTGGPEQVERYFALLQKSRYHKRRSNSKLFVIALIGLVGILFAISVALTVSLPASPEFKEKVQAGICRKNMRKIESAIVQYHSITKEYPPCGRLNSSHPLVEDAYLDEAPRCPATKHYYLLVKKGNKVVVECDSGKNGHSLDNSSED